MRPIFLVPLLLVMVFVADIRAYGAAPAPLPQPEGPVVLTVFGKVGVTNRNGAAVFDMGMLKSFPQVEITTGTEWTEGMQRFSGVLMTDLLERIDAGGTTLYATALNDYRIDIPVADFAAHRVLLALEHNGAPMPVREKGPMWLIYPSADPTGRVPLELRERMIWQIKSFELR